MEKGKEKHVVEAVEIRIWSRVEAEDGKTVRKDRISYGLDPDQFTLSQQQQYEKDVSKAGKVVDHVKVGRPHLVLHGVVISGQQDLITTEEEKEAAKGLDVDVSKVADLVKFKALWEGKQVLEYEVTESAMMTEMFGHHLEIIIGSIVERTGLSKDQVREVIAAAVSNHVGAPKETLSLASRS